MIVPETVVGELIAAAVALQLYQTRSMRLLRREVHTNTIRSLAVARKVLGRDPANPEACDHPREPPRSDIAADGGDPRD